MFKKFNKISFKLIIIAMILTMFAILTTTIFVYNKVKYALIIHIRKSQLKNFLNTAKINIQTQLTKAIETSLLLANDPTLIKWFEGYEQDENLGNLSKQKLTLLVKKFKYFTVFAVNRFTGHYWTNNNILLDTISKNDPDDSWFFESIKMKKPITINIDYNRELGNTYVFFNALMKDPLNPVGVAGVGIDFKTITKEFISYKLTSSSVLWLIDKKGKIYISTDIDSVNKNLKDYLPLDIQKNLFNTEKDFYEFFYTENRKKMEFVYTPIHPTEYIVALKVPLDELLTITSSIKRYTIIISIISFLISAILFFLLINSLIKPLQKVKESMDNISKGKGDLTILININSNDEIGDLAHSFNKFLKNLNSMIINIKKIFISNLEISKNILNYAEETSSESIEISQTIDLIKEKNINFNKELINSKNELLKIRDLTKSVKEQIEEQSTSVTESSTIVEELISSINN